MNLLTPNQDSAVMSCGELRMLGVSVGQVR